MFGVSEVITACERCLEAGLPRFSADLRSAYPDNKFYEGDVEEHYRDQIETPVTLLLKYAKAISVNTAFIALTLEQFDPIADDYLALVS